MPDARSSDFKENDRVELSEEFEVFAHGNGFQLRLGGNYYSIIPVITMRNFGRKISWEVNEDRNRFGSLHKAIEYVLELEDISVDVFPIREFYGIEDEEVEE